MSDFVEKRKLVFRIIFILSVVLAISMLLFESDYLSSRSYQFHEIIGIPLMFSGYSIPIAFAAWVYYLLRSRGTELFDFHRPASVISQVLQFVFVLICCVSLILFSYGMSTTGVAELSSKKVEGTGYYLLFEDRILRCTENEYNLVTVGNTYMIKYECNRLVIMTTWLDYIELIDE